MERASSRPAWVAVTVSLAHVRPACMLSISSSMGLVYVPARANTAWHERTSLVPPAACSEAISIWPSSWPLNTTSRPSADSEGWYTW